MSSIRERALDAAITLIGTAGVRALTHGRIDRAAGLPAGSTSNYFRTRNALVAGVIEHIARAERADAGEIAIDSPEALISALEQMILVQTGPMAPRTRARYALFLEADRDAVLPLREQRVGFERWIDGILFQLGGTPARAHTPFLMATAEGVLLHRLTVDPDAPVTGVIRRAVAACLDTAEEKSAETSSIST